MITKISNIIPLPIKNILGKMGFRKLLRNIRTKEDIEFSYQFLWAEIFKDNKLKVLEYWKNYRNLDEIIRICGFTDNTKVLDVGCGISTVLHYVKGERFGIDPLATEYLKIYEYPVGINIKKGFGENINHPNDFFDVVISSNSIDHTSNPHDTMNEIYRVLKKTGYLVLLVEVFESKIQRDAAHPHSFTENDLYSLVENKFEIIFQKESPWIGEKEYVDGIRDSFHKERIMVLEKL